MIHLNIPISIVIINQFFKNHKTHYFYIILNYNAV